MDENKNALRGEVEIDLQEVFLALIKKAHIISAAAVICAALAAFGAFLFVKPLYESSVMFYVNNGKTENISSGDISASKSLVDSYIIILETRDCLEEIAAVSKTDFSAAEAEKMISAAAVRNTEIFKVTVSAENPKDAKALAEAVAAVLPERISGIIEGTFAKVVEKPVLPSKPGSPDYVKIIIIGASLGLVLSAGFFAVRKIYFPAEKSAASESIL